MQKLRGSGNTFSTSGREWLPFRMNPKVGRRNGRLHRLIKAGKLKPPTTKADQQRELDVLLGRCPHD